MPLRQDAPSPRSRTVTWLVIPIVALLGSGCGTHPGGGGDGGAGPDGGQVVSLSVAPQQVTLQVVDGVAQSASVVVTATLPDGSSRDVTAEATYVSPDTRVVQASAGTLTAPGTRAGTVQVEVRYGGASATLEVRVRVQTHQLGSGVAAGVPGLFDAATDDPSAVASIAYPADETVVPPNLGTFEVHFVGAPGDDLFEVELASEDVSLVRYASEGGGRGWVRFEADAWALLAADAGGESFEVRVRSLASGAPSRAHRAPALRIQVESEAIEGGLYYWASKLANGQAGGVFRHDFGKVGTDAERYYTTAESPNGRCVACHALSRDGTRMAITFDGGDGAATILDVASRTPILAVDGSFAWNFATFAPSGDVLATVSKGTLVLRDADTGAVLDTVSTPGYATHPDFSPLGDALTYVVVGAPAADWHFGRGRIVVQPYDASTGTLGTPRDLVPESGENTYYPAFSPDGAWIAFNRSSEDAYDDPSARLWVVPSDGTLPPARIEGPDLGGGNTDSWPRWAPFELKSRRPDGSSEPIFWLTFSSKRAFGLRLGAGDRPQIWMAPFYPERARAGLPPSAPAFRLPFQSIDSNNHIAQWTERVVGDFQ